MGDSLVESEIVEAFKSLPPAAMAGGDERAHAHGPNRLDSRYANDFEEIEKLGFGAFGAVFRVGSSSGSAVEDLYSDSLAILFVTVSCAPQQVRNRLDGLEYAIKRVRCLVFVGPYCDQLRQHLSPPSPSPFFSRSSCLATKS